MLHLLRNKRKILRFKSLYICAVLTLALSTFVGTASAFKTSMTKNITAEDIFPIFKELIEDNSPWTPKNMEITNFKIYPSKLKVPEGEVSFDMEMPANSRYLGKVSSQVTVKVNGIAIRRLRVTGKVEVYREVVCAFRSIGRGEIISSEACLQMVKRPLSKLRGKVFIEPETIIGFAASKSIRPGQVITKRMLTRPRVISRGKRVMIVAQSPFIKIKTPGVAMQDGAAGDMVVVKNIMSKKDITAMVLNEKTVKVLF